MLGKSEAIQAKRFWLLEWFPLPLGLSEAVCNGPPDSRIEANAEMACPNMDVFCLRMAQMRRLALDAALPSHDAIGLGVDAGGGNGRRFFEFEVVRFPLAAAATDHLVEPPSVG